MSEVKKIDGFIYKFYIFDKEKDFISANGEEMKRAGKIESYRVVQMIDNSREKGDRLVYGLYVR